MPRFVAPLLKLTSQVPGSNLLTPYAPGDLTDYFMPFVNHLDSDPNGKTGVQWPRYNLSTRHMLHLNEGEAAINVTSDVEYTYLNGVKYLQFILMSSNSQWSRDMEGARRGQERRGYERLGFA